MGCVAEAKGLQPARLVVSRVQPLLVRPPPLLARLRLLLQRRHRRCAERVDVIPEVRGEADGELASRTVADDGDLGAALEALLRQLRPDRAADAQQPRRVRRREGRRHRKGPARRHANVVRGGAGGHRVGVAPGAVRVVLAVRAHAEQHRHALALDQALDLGAHLDHHSHGIAAWDERHQARTPLAAQLLHVAAAEAARVHLHIHRVRCQRHRLLVRVVLQLQPWRLGSKRMHLKLLRRLRALGLAHFAAARPYGGPLCREKATRHKQQSHDGPRATPHGADKTWSFFDERPQLSPPHLHTYRQSSSSPSCKLIGICATFCVLADSVISEKKVEKPKSGEIAIYLWVT